MIKNKYDYKQFRKEEIIPDLQQIDENQIEFHQSIDLHSQMILYMYFKEDDLVTVSKDFNVKFHNLTNKQTYKQFYLYRDSTKYSQNFINCAYGNEDYMYFGYEDSAIIQFDLKTQQEVHTFEYHQKPILLIKPYNEFLMTCCTGGEILFWKNQICEQIFQIGFEIEHIQIENDFIYTLGQYQILSIVNVKVKFLMQTQEISNHEFQYFIVNFFVNNEVLYVCTEQQKILIFNLQDLNEKLFTIDIEGIVTKLYIIQDYLFVCNDRKQILLLNSSIDYQCQHVINQHKDEVSCLMQYNDFIISASFDHSIKFHNFKEIQSMIFQLKLQKNSDVESKKYQVYNQVLPKKRDKLKKY